MTRPGTFYYEANVWRYLMPLHGLNKCKDTFHCEAPFHQLHVLTVTPPPANSKFRIDLSPRPTTNKVYTENSQNQIEDLDLTYRTCHLEIEFSNTFSSNASSYIELELQCVNPTIRAHRGDDKYKCENDEPDFEKQNIGFSE